MHSEDTHAHTNTHVCMHARTHTDTVDFTSLREHREHVHRNLGPSCTSLFLRGAMGNTFLDNCLNCCGFVSRLKISLVHAIIFTAIQSELKSTLHTHTVSCMQKFLLHLAVVETRHSKCSSTRLVSGMSGSKMMQMVL